MDIVQKAKELAHRAHAGQVDKAGLPYIEHVGRVAAAVSDDPVAEAVAWLHDVKEDSPDFAREVDEFPMEVLWPVDLLDRTGTPAHFYFRRIRNEPVALRVKLADIADNADESRLALLPPDVADRLRKKYAKARKALGVEE